LLIKDIEYVAKTEVKMINFKTCGSVLVLAVVGCIRFYDDQEAASPVLTNMSNLSMTMDAFYFSNIFLEKPNEHGEIDVLQQTQKLRSKYTWQSSSDAGSNLFLCTYKHKERGTERSIKCEYLGSWRGHDIVARYYNTGDSADLSNMIICSLNKGNLRIYKIILFGDRAVGGILGHPMFDGNGRIFYYRHIPNNVLLKHANLSENIIREYSEGNTCPACYGIVGKYVYDIDDDSTKILSINILSAENQNSQIKSLILQVTNNGSAMLDEDQTQEFLEKLRQTILVHRKQLTAAETLYAKDRDAKYSYFYKNFRSIDQIKSAMQQSANFDVNALRGDSETTLLHWAAYIDDLEMVKFLIAAGAKSTVADYTLSSALVETTDPNVAKLLLNNGADINDDTYGMSCRTPLCCAILRGNLRMVKFYVEQGADLNKTTCDMRKTTHLYEAFRCLEAIQGKDKKFFSLNKSKPLRENYIEIIKILIENGADVNQTCEWGEFSPLKAARKLGNHKILELLQTRGAK
jgi:ankyrin repeat protein